MKQAVFLFVYSTLKAFLPLPSLEIVLIPLIIQYPNNIILYSLIGSMGTMLGGSIGYFIASLVKESFFIKWFGEKTWNSGKKIFHKYGILAVFIGGVTPIPDFLLAYVAGFLKMNYYLFVLSDSIARLIRSLIILYIFVKLEIIIDMDRYGMYILYIMVFYFLFRYLYNFLKNKKK